MLPRRLPGNQGPCRRLTGPGNRVHTGAHSSGQPAWRAPRVSFPGAAVTETRSAALVRIHPADNVLVLTRSVPAGSEVVFEERAFRVEAELGLGHKLAAADIAAGEKVLKYGLPIGSATRAIRAGEHVHVHNLQSDYLPTYTHDEGQRYGRGAS